MSYDSRYPPPRSNHYPPPRDYRSERDRNRESRNRSGPRDAYRRPSYSDRNDYRPSYDSGTTYPGPPGADNYRPPQSDFTFRVDKPAGVQEANTYRPQTGRRARNDRHEPPPAKRQRKAQDSGPRNGANARQSRDGRSDKGYGGRPWRPFIAAERELLKTDHAAGSELAFFDTEGGVTYRPVDELSDSDEAEMDISGDDTEASAEPVNKRAKLSIGQSASDNNTPKWSNPDPYTALPPETATQAKKKDVVQMIRKARVQAKEVRTSLPSEAADFISLDIDDSDVSEEGEEQEELPAPAAGSLPAKPAVTVPGSVPAAPRPARELWPDPTPSALGSRKRTHDDEIKMPHTKLKKASKAPAGGGIVSEWRADPHQSPTPWMTNADHSRSANVAVWLHKEIVDFYDYIRPRDFEQRLRTEVVQELKDFCRQVFRDAEVYPFGSFPSGLYLPTADMDLVFMSDRYAAGGAAKYATKTALHRFKGQLVNHKMAWENEIELILHAKVPLVKFIEHRTGLKIDVSFENSTGLTAIKTFKAWREQYPGMPALVTLIKHFLLMRGLNEPVNGGIGGFSVICLVVSMLQMMPDVQSGNLDTRHHLGQLLLHFFDLYGNKFNYQNIAISLNPPRWIPKHQVTDFAYKNHDRLSIIDPNNPANDISGGSSNAGTIFSLFAQAYQDLTEQMARLAQDPNRRGQSILGVIMGGNYSSFQRQRDYLEMLSKGGTARPSKQSTSERPSREKDRPSRKRK